MCPVALDESRVAIQLDDFADKLIIADLDQLEHFGSSHPLSHNHYISKLLQGPDTLKILP